jgi:hypothetical protein
MIFTMGSPKTYQFRLVDAIEVKVSLCARGRALMSNVGDGRDQAAEA